MPELPALLTPVENYKFKASFISLLDGYWHSLNFKNLPPLVILTTGGRFWGIRRKYGIE